MSVEGHGMGAGIIGGGGAATISSLANTGNPLFIGVLVGLAIVVAIGLAVRRSQRRQQA